MTGGFVRNPNLGEDRVAVLTERLVGETKARRLVQRKDAAGDASNLGASGKSRMATIQLHLLPDNHIVLVADDRVLNLVVAGLQQRCSEARRLGDLNFALLSNANALRLGMHKRRSDEQSRCERDEAPRESVHDDLHDNPSRKIDASRPPIGGCRHFLAGTERRPLLCGISRVVLSGLFENGQSLTQAASPRGATSTA